MTPRRSRALRGAVLLATLIAGCSSVSTATDVDEDDPQPAATTAPAPTNVTEATPTATPSESVRVAYQPTLTRDDIDCSEETLALADPTYLGAFVAAHYVVGDTLGAVCFGEEDEALLAAWELLRVITPPEQFAPLSLFAGFAHRSDGTDPLGELVAFVNTTGDGDGTQFQMSINLLADEEEDALLLTLAHEFSHVFTQADAQLDRTMDPFACPTFYNGEGCFEADSYLAQWTEHFWNPDDLAAVDPWVQDAKAAADRCSVDGGFLGAYAATAPEEDFAEAFSAFAFDVPVETPGLEQRMAFFAAHPELAAFRDRARAAGLTPIDNVFEPCGS